MTNQEAISKLEYLINSPDGREEIDETCYEVMEYLSAQEPRVMTLEEWKNLPEPKDSECLCYEINDGSRLQAMLIKAFAGSVHLYGKAFRCWTSRPTDEHREATPWEQ